MKFIASMLLQKCEGRKRGKYLIALEVTDHDIENFEDFAVVDLEQLGIDNPKKLKRLEEWMSRIFWTVFHKMWRKYDEYDN